MSDQVSGFAVKRTDLEAASLLEVKGDLDLATAKHLVAAAREIPARLVPVVLDLHAVSFVDSSGMRALFEVAQIVHEARRPLALLRPSAPVTRLMDLVDVRSQFVELEDLDGDTLEQLAVNPVAGPPRA